MNIYLVFPSLDLGAISFLALHKAPMFFFTVKCFHSTNQQLQHRPEDDEFRSISPSSDLLEPS